MLLKTHIKYLSQTSFTFKSSWMLCGLVTKLIYGWCQKQTINWIQNCEKHIKLWSPSTNCFSSKWIDIKPLQDISPPLNNLQWLQVPNHCKILRSAINGSVCLGVSMISLTHTLTVLWHSSPSLTAKPVQYWSKKMRKTEKNLICLCYNLYCL